MFVFSSLIKQWRSMYEGTIQIARDTCGFPNMATGLHCAVSAFHAPDSALTDVIPAASKTVSINKQLLCGIQVSEAHVQLSEPQAQHRTMLHAANTCGSCKRKY